MKRFLYLLAGTTLGILTVSAGSVSSLSGSDFQAGRIVDDAVFTNKNSMSVAEIQNFLNAKVPTCDNAGEKTLNGVKRKNYNNSHPAPFTCLKQYYENPSNQDNNYGKFQKNSDGSYKTSGTGEYIPSIPSGAKSAAQIIWDAAQAHDINPQTLIITLQKEMSLVTDDWPWSTQYEKAMGYGCPDTAPCDTQYYGFANQINNAASQFRRYMTYPDNYNYAVGDRYILYNPNASCGGSNVRIETAATAALYNYTPYQPNQAALNNLYGSGNNCSAYGNRNFWRLFNDWFGSTLGSSTFSALTLTSDSTAAGDFNGDGYDDLAVGSPGEGIGSANNAGSVTIAFGSGPNRIKETNQQQLWQGSGLRGNLEANDYTGASLAAGDFNGDGYDDLAVGSPGEGIGSADNAGVVTIVFGSSSGLSPTGQQQFYQGGELSGAAEEGDFTGASLAIGDFNNDTYIDLAIGSPGEDLGPAKAEAGLIDVVFGGNTGLKTSGQQSLHKGGGGLDGSSDYSDFVGASLAAGDFNGDGYDDLVVGSPLEQQGAHNNAGSVNVLYGSASGVATSNQQLLAQGSGLRGILEANDYTGTALATGDFNGDGYDDLALSAAGEEIYSRDNAGSINVIYGGSGGLNTDNQQQLWQGSGIQGNLEKGDYTGTALATGDFNGDGYDDLALSSAGEGILSHSNAGLINIIYSNSSGLNIDNQKQLWQSSGLRGILEAQDYTGTSLISGDFNGDGYIDLVVGATGEAIGANDHAGVIIATYGTSSGISVNNQQQLWQGSGLKGNLEPRDYVGGDKPTELFW